MAAEDIAFARRRVEAVLHRRPSAGMHEDASATVRWDGGTRVVARHDNGVEVRTDMPTEFGGSGDQVSPGWLLRAGYASCTATLIAMVAASEGVALTSLELVASSRSDSRAILGMNEPDGTPVAGGPSDMQLLVRIAADGVSEQQLRALVEEAYRRSPMRLAVETAIPVSLRVELAR